MGYKKFLIFAFLFLSAVSFAPEAGAADIVLEDLDGKKVNISNLPKQTILFFWTTWCPYCRKELKQLNELYPGIKKEGINLFAVNVGESASKIRGFLKSYGLGFRVLLDKDAVTADKYSLMGVPTYVFITKTGKIISDKHNFPSDYKKLLNE